MLEHTTLEKVTSFTQAAEPRYLALARVYLNLLDYQCNFWPASSQVKKMLGFRRRPHSKSKDKGGMEPDKPRNELLLLPQIFWDPDPEHTLVEEDQEWVSLCPRICAEKSRGLSACCLGATSMLPVASVR